MVNVGRLLILCLHVEASNLFHHKSHGGDGPNHSKDIGLVDAGTPSHLALALKAARASRTSYGGLAHNYTTRVQPGSRGHKLVIENLMAQRGSFPSQYYASGLHRQPPASKPAASPVLLALMASSEVPWPARIEVLLNSLVTLEGALGGVSSGDGSSLSSSFDLVVILDSHGEPKPKNSCRDSKVSTC